MHIRWLDLALNDLENIYQHIKKDKSEVATRIALRIQKYVDHLAQYPGMGRAGRAPYTRELVIPDTPYILPYRVKGDVIEILRVLHGAQSWPLN